jgi:hypothetical protein
MKSSKWWRDEAAPVNAPGIPIWKPSHTFPKSAVQVKVVLDGINVCNLSPSGNMPKF